MSNVKHTPGPWKMTLGGKSEIREEGRFMEPPEYEMIVISESPNALPEKLASFWDCEWGYEAEANARLIAAAPDLLEALEAVLDSDSADVDECFNYSGDEAGNNCQYLYHDGIPCYWCKARAAIDKATTND